MLRKFFFLILSLSYIHVYGQIVSVELLNPRATAFNMMSGDFYHNTGIMCGIDGAVVITYDEGETWNTILLPPYVNLRQSYIGNDSTAWVMADTLLYKTTDGGATWNIIYHAPSGLTFRKFRNAGNTCFILAQDTGNLIYSKLISNSNNFSGSSTIIDLSIPYILDFDFSTPQSGIFISYQSIYATIDGGMTLTKILDLDEGHYLRCIQYAGEATFYAGGWVSEEGKNLLSINASAVWKSTDNGQTWELLPLPFTVGSYSLIVSLNTAGTDTIIAGAQHEEVGNWWPVFISVDGGSNWSRGNINPDIFQYLEYPQEITWTAASTTKFWAWEGDYYKALTFGNKPDQFYFYDEIATYSIGDLAVNGKFIPDQTMFIVMMESWFHLQQSLDHGFTWDTVWIGNPVVYGWTEKISFADPYHGIANSAHLTFYTTNGGQTWIAEHRNGANFYHVIDLEYPVSSVVYRLLSKYDYNTNMYQFIIEKSTDYGKTWQDMNIPPTYHFSQMVFTSAEEGFVFGTDKTTMHGGYLYTNNGGMLWEWKDLGTAGITAADMLNDSSGYIFSKDTNLFQLHIAAGINQLTPIQIPAGYSISNLDFTDTNHGVILATDENFMQVMYTTDGGLSWGINPKRWPKSLNQVKLTNNLLNGYVFGYNTVILWLDDGLPLGTPYENRQKITLSPNPAKDFIRISTSHPLNNAATIEILNPEGQVVLKTHTTLPASININGLAPGFYIYKIDGTDIRAYGKLLIVN